LILEASLKGLIKDADTSGRSLNDELSRRQNQLERLLSDLTATENRLSLQRQAIEQQIASQAQVQVQKAQAQTATPKATKIEIENDMPAAPTFEATVRNKTKQSNAIERTSNQIRSAAEDVRALARQIEVARVTDDNRIETLDEELARKEQEQPQLDSKPQTDNRLGVLGTMKRQVQTL
jgi:predicted  nucleic acid-binding Zn-ribbon protein